MPALAPAARNPDATFFVPIAAPLNFPFVFLIVFANLLASAFAFFKGALTLLTSTSSNGTLATLYRVT